MVAKARADTFGQTGLDGYLSFAVACINGNAPKLPCPFDRIPECQRLKISATEPRHREERNDQSISVEFADVPKSPLVGAVYTDKESSALSIIFRPRSCSVTLSNGMALCGLLGALV